MMVNIVIRNPKPSDLKMDTSDDEDNEFDKADINDKIEKSETKTKSNKCEIKIDGKIIDEARLGIRF